MIKEAIHYIVSLSAPNVQKIGEQNYSDKKLEHITDPRPTAIKITSLTGIVDYIKSSIDKYSSEQLLIHVRSHNEVNVYSALRSDKTRECYLNCVADLPNISFNSFHNVESFNIMLQSCFVLNNDRGNVLKVVGNIKEENVRSTGDDGISQTVTAKVGIAKVADIPVPNPVYLKPFRTFHEVDQPESAFVFRMKDGPSAALFEADGGAWKNQAMLNIKDFLEKNLTGCEVEIIA